MTDFEPERRNENEEQAVDLVRTWAEEVVRQVQHLRAVRKQAEISQRNYERFGEWGDEQVQVDYRAQFAAEPWIPARPGERAAPPAA